MSTFEKSCGKFSMYVSPPSPNWVTIKWEDGELRRADEEYGNTASHPHIQIEDLRDLRYLINRALAAVGETA